MFVVAFTLVGGFRPGSELTVLLVAGDGLLLGSIGYTPE